MARLDITVAAVNSDVAGRGARDWCVSWSLDVKASQQPAAAARYLQDQQEERGVSLELGQWKMNDTGFDRVLTFDTVDSFGNLKGGISSRDRSDSGHSDRVLG